MPSVEADFERQVARARASLPDAEREAAVLGGRGWTLERALEVGRGA
jgi:hypothetical protein